MLRNCYTEGLYAEGTDKMKKLFNHTKRPERNWEEDVQDGYDWDEEQEGEEYYADDEEYTGEEDGEEYYADDEEYTGEDGEEYYADDEEYTGEDGEEYYADDEEYTGEDEEGEEYYADDEEYTGEEDGEEYYADDEEYTGEDEDGEEYYADEEELYDEESGYEYEDDVKASKKQGKKKFAAIWSKFLNMSAMDRIMAATGVAVLILAIVTGSVYASARMVDNQVSEFVSVGTQLDGIHMIGEQGLLAVADATVAKIAAANAVDEDYEDQKEYNEAEYTNGGTVELEVVSVQKDLKIKFTNKKSGKLISNVPFNVTITDPKGKTETWSDDDMDGIIYKKGITPGNYTVAVNALTDEKYKDYTLPTGTQKVEVKKDIAYKKVDVSNEIKKESEINAAKEDTMQNDTVVESVLEDTVQWVESKTLPPSYREVGKDKITNPETVAYSGNFLRMANTTLTLAVGDTTTLKPTNEKATNISWSTTDAKKATVDNGTVKALEAGKVTIICTYDVPGEATPTPTPEASASPSPTPTPTPTPTPEVTTTPEVTASPEVTATPEATETSTPEPAETPVASAGTRMIQTMGSGSAIVAYTQTGSNKQTDTWEITITDKTATATLDPASVSTAAGAEATSQIKVTNYTGTATYKVATKNEKIATATVDANGKITVKGVAAGDTTVTATVTMGSVTKTLDLAVKVTAKMAITLDKTAVTVYPKSTATVTATVSGSGTVTASSSDTNIATVSVNGKTITITGVKAGSATITAVYKEGNSEVKATCTVKVGTSNPREDKTTVLKDTSGKELYVLDGNNQYRLAHYADYYTSSNFYIKEATRYTGWQTLDGKVYFFKADGNKVTGEQVIQGAKYNFASDGSLVVGSGTMGIDVSKWNGTIDWNAVKNSGVNYVIIRVGYRGSSQGALIEDPKFKTNIKGATAAGIKVGVYFFTQAVDEVEAVQEASMVLDRISGYKISYPVFLDVEGSGGRGDAIDSATRTAVCKAFCNTIKNAGYTPGIYANKTWLSSKMDAGALSGYKIWLAQYAKTPTYTGRYDLWQYRSDGKVSGISGKVDLNISYLGY